jgi:hypothetical protein
MGLALVDPTYTPPPFLAVSDDVVPLAEERAGKKKLYRVVCRHEADRGTRLAVWILQKLNQIGKVPPGVWHDQATYDDEDKALTYKDFMERNSPEGDLWVIYETTLNEALPRRRIRPKWLSRDKKPSGRYQVIRTDELEDILMRLKVMAGTSNAIDE